MLNSVLDKSIFIVSLDLELGWGFLSHPQHKALSLLRSEPQKARGTTNLLLRLFERYDIPATWAVVGHLFLDPDRKEELIHKEMPQFKEGWIDWGYYCALDNDSLYYGNEIVERILTSPVKHEIGLHSFFHVPFHQCSRKVAEIEVELGTKLVKRFGVKPISFVFPGNHVGNLDVLRNYGFQIYRGRNAGYYDEGQYLPIRKLNSAIDKLIAPPVLPTWKDGIWELPSSTYFCDPRFPFTLLPRAKLGLNRAIRAREVFHIFLHPWDLLLHEPLAKDLESFLALVANKRDGGKLQVMTMGVLASYLNQRLQAK